MATELINYFQKVQEFYLEKYRKAVTKFKSEYETCIVEIAYKAPDPCPFVENYGRLDIVVDDDGLQGIAVCTDNMKLTNEDNFELDKIRINLSPIVWNGVDFHCEKFDVRNSKFLEWLDKWLDMDDKSHSPQKEFQNVMHSVAVEQTDEFKISIDFGSAPVEALLDFLPVLKIMGNQSVSLDSNWNIQESD